MMSARNPDAPDGEKPRRLTDEQVASIIEDRLDGYSVRETATRNDVATNTVQARYKQWLVDTTEARRAEMEQHRSDVGARLQRIANRATKTADTMGDGSVEQARLLTVGVRALAEMSRIVGMDAPKQVQVSAAVTMTEAEADAILNEDTDESS